MRSMWRAIVYVLAAPPEISMYRKTVVNHGNASATICRQFIQFDSAERHADCSADATSLPVLSATGEPDDYGARRLGRRSFARSHRDRPGLCRLRDRRTWIASP